MLIDLRGALIKYLKNQRKQEKCTKYPPRAIRTIKLCLGLTKSYIEIRRYSENFFCTAEIQTIPYCLYVYKQHINREPIEYPLFVLTEISENLPKVEKALSDFKAQIIRFYKLLKEMLPKEHQKSRLQNFIYKIKKSIKKNLIHSKRRNDRQNLFYILAKKVKMSWIKKKRKRKRKIKTKPKPKRK